MPNLIQIYLARHGETKWNLEQRIQGQLDSDLTQLGHHQAEKLAHQLAKLKVSHIFSSPLGRAKSTALICSEINQTELTLSDALQERHFGQWQQQTLSSLTGQVHFEQVFHQVSDFSAPQGETGITAAKRFKQGLTELINLAADQDKSHHKAYAVISHGDVMRCFLANINNSNKLNSTGKTQNAYSLFKNGKLIKLHFDRHNQMFTLC